MFRHTAERLEATITVVHAEENSLRFIRRRELLQFMRAIRESEELGIALAHP